MNKSFMLSQDIKYRREEFGSLIYQGRSKESRFFNHAASLIIEKFYLPTTLTDVKESKNLISNSTWDIDQFLALLQEDGIIQPVDQNNEQRAKMFFTNEVNFPENRLYTPIGVELELTLKCMRRCTYCAYDSSPLMGTSGELDRETINNLFKRLYNLGTCYIRFTGGDPLTRKDTLDIVEDADKLGFAIAIASDLTILSEEHIDRISQLQNLTAIQTTLDGPSLKIADMLRGSGNFRRVTNGIDKLRNKGIPILVGTVLTKLNYQYIFETAKYLSKWDVGYCVSPLYDAGRARNQNDLIPSDDELANAYEQFANAVQQGLVRAADPGWEAIAEKYDTDARRGLWAGQPWMLRSPDRILRVDPFGRCYTSIHLKNILEDNVYIGRWPESDIMNLWQSSPLLEKMRKAANPHPYYGNVIDIRKLSSFNHMEAIR